MGSPRGVLAAAGELWPSNLRRPSLRQLTTRTWLLVVLLLAKASPLAASPASFIVPPLTSPVVDKAGMLSVETQTKLAGALLKLSKQQGGSQLAVVTLPSLGGESIEQVGIKIADQWQLGRKEEDRGLILLFAKSERQVRIEVGQGLEGSLTDAHAKRIINETIVPLMQKGYSDDAVIAGLYQILARTDPEFDFAAALGRPIGEAGEQDFFSLVMDSGYIWIWLLIFFILLRGFGPPGSRRRHSSWQRGGFRGGGGFGGGLGGGGFGGGLGGGGGYSGGGGGFSGGGASGSW